MTDPDKKRLFHFFPQLVSSLLVHTRRSAHASPGGLAPFLWPGEVIQAKKKKKRKEVGLLWDQKVQWERHSAGSTKKTKHQRQQKTKNVNYGQDGGMAGMCCLLLRQRDGCENPWKTVKVSTSCRMRLHEHREIFCTVRWCRSRGGVEGLIDFYQAGEHTQQFGVFFFYFGDPNSSSQAQLWACRCCCKAVRFPAHFIHTHTHTHTDTQVCFHIDIRNNYSSDKVLTRLDAYAKSVVVVSLVETVTFL